MRVRQFALRDLEAVPAVWILDGGAGREAPHVDVSGVWRERARDEPRLPRNGHTPLAVELLGLLSRGRRQRRLLRKFRRSNLYVARRLTLSSKWIGNLRRRGDALLFHRF